MEGISVNVVKPVQFFRFLKGRCHGNQFCVVVDLFAQRPVSQDPLNRFSQTLHHMVDIELRMINPTFLPHILKDVAMETNLVAKIGQNYLPLALIALSFRKVMIYRYLYVRVNSMLLYCVKIL